MSVNDDWVYLYRFTRDWVCKNKYIDILVCCCMLCSLLDILTHLWVHFSKSYNSFQNLVSCFSNYIPKSSKLSVEINFSCYML